MHAERFDAMVTFAGCDKSLPGMLMAAARLNLPAVFVYGGSILPGHAGDQALDIVSVFEAVGAHATGALSDAELSLIEHNACPTAGSCAGMFTANTMASVAEALGMSLPGSASPPAVDRRRDDGAFDAGRAVVGLLERNIRPRQIMTKEAFENAIAVVMALGGSTNAVLHLLAIANEARVDLVLDDFNRVGARVPHIADTKPHGRYHMADVDRIGGVPVVMRELLEAGLLHGECLTVTGRTVAENLAALDPARPRRRGHPPAVEPHPRRRRHRRAHRIARPPGLGGEGGRHRHPGLLGHRPRLRRRAGRPRRHPGRLHRTGHRGRHPLRGPEGRPRHARDAGRHRRHEGGGTRRRLRPRHRRPLLGRDPRLLCRPRRPRGGRRRSHRLRGRRGPGSSSTSPPSASTWPWTTPSWPNAGPQWKLPEPRYRTGVLAKYARLVTGAERGAITEP